MKVQNVAVSASEHCRQGYFGAAQNRENSLHSLGGAGKVRIEVNGQGG